MMLLPGGDGSGEARRRRRTPCAAYPMAPHSPRLREARTRGGGGMPRGREERGPSARATSPLALSVVGRVSEDVQGEVRLAVLGDDGQAGGGAPDLVDPHPVEGPADDGL